MLITERYSISQADYNRSLKDEKYKDEMIGWRAHFSAYPPAGYGAYNKRVEKDESGYYAVWDRSNNCD